MSPKSTKFLTHQNAAVLNRNAILSFIKDNAPISRTDIWEEMELSRASVTQIIKLLIEQGFVYETGTGESRGGRKPCYLEFSANARNILAFDWHLKTLFLTNLNSDIIFSKPVPVLNTTSAEDFVAILSQSVEEVIKVQKLDAEKLLGLGLIMPGLIDPTKGLVMLSTDQGWNDVYIAGMVEKAVGMRTLLGSDGNMQALGEYIYGFGQKVKDFVLLTIEDYGVGSALILNGTLQQGSNNMSGEVGHISLSNDGPQCSCGKKGCIEAYLKAILRKKSNNWKNEAAGYIGLAVAIIINMLDPKVVILSGNVIDKGGDDLLLLIKNVTMSNVLNAQKRDVKLDKSSAGCHAGLKGICSLIYDMSFKQI